MADYHPLIARAVAGLDNPTGEARRTLYERARTALVAQLRSTEPPLSESDITRERLALEDAIRRVESEAARRPLDADAPFAVRPAPPPVPQYEAPAQPEPEEPDTREWQQREYRDQPQDEPPPAEAPASADRDQDRFDLVPPEPPAEPPPAETRDEPPEEAPSLRDQGLKGFRDIVGSADQLGEASAQSAREARSARDTFNALPGLGSDRSPPRYDEGRSIPADSGLAHPQPPLNRDELEPPQRTTPTPYYDDTQDSYEAPRRSYRGAIRAAVVLLLLVSVAALAYWQRDTLMSVTSLFRSSPAPTTTATRDAAPAQAGRPKIADRIGGAQDTRPGASPATAAAQKVVLYEEVSGQPEGKRYVGSAVWRTETVSPGPGLAPEFAVRGDIEIPERRMRMTWSLRRNADRALPASHTIEIMFTLPADFSEGGVNNVPGVLMKAAEQTRGVPLAGLAVKVTSGFFLIGLSSVEADLTRNIQLLKERAWFDIPVVYNNGKRAILAVEKGAPGERAFEDAFRAWNQ